MDAPEGGGMRGGGTGFSQPKQVGSIDALPLTMIRIEKSANRHWK